MPDTEVDQIGARELMLFIENDSHLYRRRAEFDKNLDRKRARGVYDPKKAVTLWLYYVDEGARKYNREFGPGPTLVGFDKPTRLAVAREFAAATIAGSQRDRRSKMASMYLLSNEELRDVERTASRASAGGPRTWDPFYRAWHKVPAVLSFPTGELTNPRIAGFIWALNMRGEIGRPVPITAGDRFDAQGLEGKIEIGDTLGDAVLIAEQLPPNRVNIHVDKTAYSEFSREWLRREV